MIDCLCMSQVVQMRHAALYWHGLLEGLGIPASYVYLAGLKVLLRKGTVRSSGEKTGSLCVPHQRGDEPSHSKRDVTLQRLNFMNEPKGKIPLCRGLRHG